MAGPQTMPDVQTMARQIAEANLRHGSDNPLLSMDPEAGRPMEDVPLAVRIAVASAKSPQDKIDALKQWYPDAVMRRTGGETVIDGRPAYLPPREAILFTHPGSEDHPELKGKVMRYDPHWWDPAPFIAALGDIKLGIGDPRTAGNPDYEGQGILGNLLGVKDTRSLPEKTVSALGDTVNTGLNAIGATGAGETTNLATQALERGAATRLVGKEAAAGGMGRGEVLDAMQRQGVPLEGGAGLVTTSRNTQGKVWQLMRNPKSADTIRNAVDQVDNRLEQVFGEALDATGGRPISKAEVGAGVRGGLEDLEQHVMKGGPAGEGTFRGLRNQRVLEDAAATAAGGGKDMVPVPTIRRDLEDMIDVARGGATDAKGNAMKPDTSLVPQDLLDLKARIDANGGQLPMDYLRQKRSWMGEKGGAHTLLPGNAPELERLYGSSTEDLGNYYKAKGGSAFDAWNEGQANYKAWAMRRDALRQIVQSQDFERAADIAARGGTDAKTGLARLDVLTDSLGPQELADLKRMKLAQLGMKGQGETAEFTLPRYLEGWKNTSDEMKDWLTRDKPELRQSLDDLYTIGNARKDFMGARDPGTAGAIEQQKSLKAQAWDILTLPLTAPAKAMGEVAGILGPEAKARLITNPKFVRWLAEGGQLPADGSAFAAHIARLGSIAASMKGEAEAGAAIKSYVAELRNTLDLNQGAAAGGAGAPAKPTLAEEADAQARKAGVRVKPRGEQGK